MYIYIYIYIYICIYIIYVYIYLYMYIHIGLFDTRAWTLRFTRLMQATWEASHISDNKRKANGKHKKNVRTFHIYSVGQHKDTDESAQGSKISKPPLLSTKQVEVSNSAMANTYIAAAQATLKHTNKKKKTHIKNLEENDIIYHEKIRDFLITYQSMAEKNGRSKYTSRLYRYQKELNDQREQEERQLGIYTYLCLYIHILIHIYLYICIYINIYT
jgi:hypothetical protein